MERTHHINPWLLELHEIATTIEMVTDDAIKWWSRTGGPECGGSPLDTDYHGQRVEAALESFRAWNLRMEKAARDSGLGGL